MGNLNFSVAAAVTATNRINIPTPTFQVWDFDDRSIVNWDTDVTAGTASELNSAIAAAMTQGRSGSPRYHRITWTGGNIGGNLTLSNGVPLPDKSGPHILVVPQDFTSRSTYVRASEFRLGSGISNVKFRGFQLEPTSTDFSGGKAHCVRFQSLGGGRRLAFEECRAGAFWRSGSVSSYPEVFGGGSLFAGWELAVKNCEFRSVFQVFNAITNWIHVEQCLVTDLIDDFIALQVLNRNGPDGRHLSRTYAVGNVVLDMTDDPAYSGFHCDFIQTGTPGDGPGDYYIQRYGNLFIGDTYQQYPTMNGIIQHGGGQGQRFELDSRDNLMLCTGTRGMYLPDRRVTLQRDFMAFPPLAGPTPSSGTGWNGGPHRQRFLTQGALGTNADIQIGHYVAGLNAQNSHGWGSLPNPVFIVDHTAALGSSQNAYDYRFPNMTGLTYSSGQARVPLYRGARTKEDVRNWVGQMYMPNTAANGLGWEANGFNNPATWFA